jgi:hypothetical protein
MILRDYQIDIVSKGKTILKQFGIVYLAMEVRTGKTATALTIANDFKRVLFITKKKAIQSILDDFSALNYKYELVVINNESLHKIDGKFDLIISDEHHRNGTYPKPNLSAKFIRANFGNLPMIFLSGTPSPESFSQLFHQFWVSNNSPFKNYKNFYSWAKDFVTIQEKNFGYAIIKDYSNANFSKINDCVSKYFIKFTQNEAGFSTQVNENVLICDLKPKTIQLISQLKRDLIIIGKEEEVVADTKVKLMQKIHQLCSGTIIFESGNGKVIDDSKAVFIKSTFANKKIAIFYKFQQELNALKEVFKDSLTTDLNEFNSTDKNIALQIVSGREGISLKNADVLVYYNIDFSALSYWQSRDRLTTMDRKSNDVFWIFSRNGIEQQIYNKVIDKKDFTLKHFNTEYL